MPDAIAPGSDRTHVLGSRLADIALGRQTTVGCAESLTSGALASRLGAAPRAGEWFRGGIVAYSRHVKHSLLDVPEGPVVCAAAARAMAENSARLLGADYVVAVTGVGGPDTQDGRPAGTVWFGVTGGGRTIVEENDFLGDPVQVLEQTVVRGLELLIAHATAR